MFKGLSSACIGLLFASVGYSPIDAVPRFVFDNMYLMSGLGMTIVLIVVFSVSTICSCLRKRLWRTAEEVDYKSVRGLGITLAEFKEQITNIIRSLPDRTWHRLPSGHGLRTFQPGGLLSSAKNAFRIRIPLW